MRCEIVLRRSIDEYRTLVAPLARAYLPDVRLDTEAAVARTADAVIERFDRARTADAQRATARTTKADHQAVVRPLDLKARPTPRWPRGPAARGLRVAVVRDRSKIMTDVLKVR